MCYNAAMRMDGVDGVILDVDGTIWDTTAVAADAWNEAIALLHLELPRVEANVLRGEFGKPMDQIALDLWPTIGEEVRSELMALCVKNEQAALACCTITPYEGVVDTVRQLSQRHAFFVVSNCQAGYIELMMEKTGLTAYITDFESFGRTGKGKAANIALLAARNHLAHPVYVGDTRGDALCCAQAGVPFVWASWGFGSEADFAGTAVAAKLVHFQDIATLLACSL